MCCFSVFQDPPQPSLSGESFILSLDPSEAVGSSPTGSRLSEEDMSSQNNLPQNKRRKNTPKRLKCETPPNSDGKGSPQEYHMQNFQQQQANNSLVQANANSLVPAAGNFPQQQLQLCNPSEHKPFTPCALPIQATGLGGHSGFGFLPRPPGFYADSGMLSVPPNQFENVESKLQTIHSAIDDLAGKLSAPHEKVMAIHEALDELVHLRPENGGNNFRCVKNERMGN